MEEKRMMAGDFGAQVMDCYMPAEVCMVVEVVEVDQVDLDETEVPSDEPIVSEGEVDSDLPETVADVTDEAPGEIEDTDDGQFPTDEIITDSPIDESAEVTDVVITPDDAPINSDANQESDANLDEDLVDADVIESEEVLADAANALRDPVTGTSGYFGMIDAETPSKTLTFAPSEEGTVDVVVASSFEGSETRIEILDGEGELVAASMTEDLSGFQKLTFDVAENETYQVNVSSDEAGGGYFMVTVEFSEAVEPEPTDVHADEIGDEATLLTIEDDGFSIQSEIDTTEDKDAFRFVAPSDGEFRIGMTSTSEGYESDAVVSVFDPAGELVVSGSTNEEVAIRFDATTGVEYQVLVDSSNDITGSFELTGQLIDQPVDSAVPDEIIDELVVTDTISEVISNLDDEPESDVCAEESVADEVGLLDEIFGQIGEDLEGESHSHFHFHPRRFSGGHRGPFGRG